MAIRAILKDSVLLSMSKAVFAAVYFYTNVVIARYFGAEQYGSYSFAMSIIAIMGIVSTFGLEKYATRYIPIYSVKDNHALVLGLIISSLGFVIVAALFWSAITVCLILFVPAFGNVMTSSLVLPVFLLICMDSILKVQKGIIQGVEKVALGSLSELVIRPVIFSLVLSFLIFYGQQMDNVAPILNWYAAVTVISICFSMWAIYRHRAKAIPLGIKPDYLLKDWLKSTLPFFFAETIFIVNSNVDIIMVGLYLGEHETGIYSVANRATTIIAFVLGSISIAMAPRIVKLHESNNQLLLQKTVTFTTYLMFFISIIIASVYFLFGKYIVNLFGNEFNAAIYPMFILSIAQVISAGAGAVGVIMMMTGYSNYVVKWVGISIFINIIGNAVLLPKFGVLGAAFATSAALIFWNIILVYFVIKKIKINPCVIRLPTFE